MTKTIKISFSVKVNIEDYMKEYSVTKEEAIEQIKNLIQDAGTTELISNGYIQEAK